MPSRQYLEALDSLRWEEILIKLGINLPKNVNRSSIYIKCFLHKEETASMNLVSNSFFLKFYCYGCHEAGDKFDFVALFKFHDRRAFRRTARWFEKKFGIPSPYRHVKFKKREILDE